MLRVIVPFRIRIRITTETAIEAPSDTEWRNIETRVGAEIKSDIANRGGNSYRRDRALHPFNLWVRWMIFAFLSHQHIHMSSIISQAFKLLISNWQLFYINSYSLIIALSFNDHYIIKYSS